MLGSRLTAAVQSHLYRLRQARLRLAPSRPRAQAFSRGGPGNFHYPPVHVVGPTLWAVTAIGTIYFSTAAFEVYQDMKRLGLSNGRHKLMFDLVELSRKTREMHSMASASAHGHQATVSGSSPTAIWESLDGPTRVILCIALANAGVFGISKLTPPAAVAWWSSLAHTPAYPYFRNRQLFTSMFAHVGALHMGLNMLCLYNFGPYTAHSEPWNGSATHFLAFYLSTGILASLAAQFSAIVFKSSRLSPGLGASGAVLGVFSAWAQAHPDGRLRIVPFPMVFTASDFLQYTAAFELLGLFGLWRLLRFPINFAHAVHLSGIGIGLAYVKYDVSAQAWTMSRRAALRSMQFLRII